MTTRYVAFVAYGMYGGFSSLETWNTHPQLHEDIDRVIEFDGPTNDSTDSDVSDRVFEEIKKLSEQVVENDLRRIPG